MLLVLEVVSALRIYLRVDCLAMRYVISNPLVSFSILDMRGHLPNKWVSDFLCEHVELFFAVSDLMKINFHRIFHASISQKSCLLTGKTILKFYKLVA